ncbi:MAG: hypothetical protein KAW17_11675 [Candidatus Eisenbacteria sp.]|nr:hypothetical protein [Candidatus Eisenbacteria bacterium]
MGVRNAKKVVKQVRKLQDIVKGTANPSAEAWSPVLSDIGQLLREAAAFLQPLSPQIKLNARVAPDLPKTHADPAQIQQMLVNLYDNSTEAFAEAGNGDGRIDIDAVWNPDDSAIVIVYADDGPGIPEDAASSIFDPGFTTKEGAEGMGLAECMVVAANHGGGIVYKSGQEKGVLFSIRLPVIESPPQ